MRVFDIGLKQCPQLAYSPDSGTLAASYFPKYATRAVRLWPLSGDEPPQERVFKRANYKPLLTYDEVVSGNRQPEPAFRVPRKGNHRSRLVCVSRARAADRFGFLICYWSRLGSRLVTTYAVRVLGESHPPIEWTLSAFRAGVTLLELSGDGSRVAVLAGPQVRVWQVSTGTELATLTDGRRLFAGLAFSADNRYLGVVHQDAVSLYDTTSWTVARTYAWKVGTLRSLAFSPDGATAAVGSDKGKVVVFDLE
jgi:WD40 repeat protein